MFRRSWDKRRIVFTKKILAFGNVADDGVLDIVPLHEIKNVRDSSLQIEVIADDDSELNGTAASNDDGAENKNVFEIVTDVDGYNSGRTYQIQAVSAQDFRTIFDNLTKLAIAAREGAEAKSRFKKSQQRVGKVFNSNVVQIVMAILIFGVRNISNRMCLRYWS